MISATAGWRAIKRIALPNKFFPAGSDATARPGWMRQRNEIEACSDSFHGETAADDIHPVSRSNELRDGQIADRNDKTRTQDFKFVVHPERAIANFLRARNAIAAAGGFAGKTAADCGKINLRAHFCFGQSTKFVRTS